MSLKARLTGFLESVVTKLKGHPYRIDPEVSFAQLATLSLRRAVLAARAILVLRRITPLAFVGRGTVIRGRSLLQVGRGTTLGNAVTIDAQSKGGVRLGANVNIGPYSILQTSGVITRLGTGISIGDNSGIGAYSFIGGGGGVRIGRDVIMGQYISFHSENHNFDSDAVPIRLQGVTRKGIEIGDDCWIGAKVTFLDGTVIGSGSVVAAGAVVRGVFPPDSVIGGVPARILKSRLRTPASEAVC